MSTRTPRSSTRKFAAAMAVALVASLLALATPVAAKQSVSTVRKSGATRYLTSTVLSKAATLAGANNTSFVLVNGSNYADALSAAALAGHKQGTIILLPADGTISADATATMAAATNVTIIGGYAALPATVETTMKTLRPTSTITRISGADRYATAAQVAQAITSTNVAAVNGKKSVFLASGTSFADAVMAASGAYSGPKNSATTAVTPILLTAKNTLSPATKAQISLLSIKQVFVLGGTSAVSAAVATEVTNLGATVIRLSGANRYATASAIADKLTTLTTSGGFGFDDDDIAIVNIEQSGGGADALAASAYLGQLKAPALGAGANGLAAETSTWLTAHNGATGVAKIHAIGGTAAVSAAQLTSADAAGTVSGPVATVAAAPGQSSAVVSFSQTVTASSAGVTTGYSIFGASAPTVNSATYSVAKNTVTLGLSAALATGHIIRVNAGAGVTAAGLSSALTDTTVGYDLTVPTCSLYARTGGSVITVTCSEKVVQNGTLDTDVDTKVTVGGVAAASTGNEIAAGQKVNTITMDSGTWSATGAAIVIQKDLFKDLAGNKVGALSGSVVTDTKKPTVVGLPTYTLTNVVKAQLVQTGTASVLLMAKTAGLGGNAITWISVDSDTSATTVTVSGKVITLTSDLDGDGAVVRPTGALVCAAVNAHSAASALVTCFVHTTGNFTDVETGATLAGGTTKMTVTTTFSEAVAASSSHILYDANGDDLNEVVSATTACIASACTSTWTLTGTANNTLPVTGSSGSEIGYTASIVDLAANTLTVTTPLLSAP